MDAINLFPKFNHGIVRCPRVDGGGPSLTLNRLEFVERLMLSDTVAGAKASAVIYSVLETAKANGVELYTWLQRVLSELPAAQTAEDVEALLP